MNSDQTLVRSWNLLGMTKALTRDNVVAHLAFSENKKASDAYADDTNPYLVDSTCQLQNEAHILYSVKRGMVERHKSRMTNYKDAVSQRKYRIWTSLTFASSGLTDFNNRQINPSGGTGFDYTDKQQV